MPEAPSTPYIGLARQYRPQTFSDLVGQDQIAHSLAQQVLSDKVAQAYIFCGPRGIGKTSAARILAKSLNCLNSVGANPCGKCEQCLTITSGSSMDVIEIDGASNNGVDDIRELQETVSQNPFAARKKIYIIDEVHMLSKGAFNALLKTLEEPPPFVIFIFATTEFEKIPETIKSRCQSFQFNRISIEDLIRRLDHVAQCEEIKMDPGERRGIFETIAFAVDGGMRDAMMALDQLRALGEGNLTLDEVVRFLGVVEHDQLLRTIEMLHQRDTRGLLEMVNSLVERGRDLERYVKNLIGFMRDLMILKSGGGEDLVNLTGEKMKRAKSLLWSKDESGRTVEALTYAELLNFIQVFMALEGELKEAVQVRIHLEFGFVKLTAIEPVVDISNLIESFNKWGKPSAGTPAPLPPAASPAPRQPVQSQAPPVSAPPAPTAPPASAPPAPSTPDLFGGGAQRSAAPSAAVAAPVAAVATGDLWSGLMAHLESLPQSLRGALKRCRFLSIEGDCMMLDVPKSFATSCLSDPERLARVEALLTQLAGTPMRLLVKMIVAPKASPVVRPPQAPLPASPQGQQAVFRENPPSSDASPREAQVNEVQDANAIYLRRDPAARSREALKNNEPFREKVLMAQRFFEGRLFVADKEIMLES